MHVKTLRRALPANKHDVDAARALVALGADTLAPVVPDMVRRLKDHDSPVVDVFCDFFAGEGERFAPIFHDFLSRTGDDGLVHVIVTRILVNWSKTSLAAFTGILQQLVSRTNAYTTDLESVKLLHRYELAERAWLKEWLDFKRRRTAAWAAEAAAIATEL